jgi:hypothetical protein
MTRKIKRKDWVTRLRRWGMVLGAVAVLVGNSERLLDAIGRLIALAESVIST